MKNQNHQPTLCHSLTRICPPRIEIAIDTEYDGCSQRGNGLVGGGVELVLVENGVRVPMSVFGSLAKHLTRNGRHARA